MLRERLYMGVPTTPTICMYVRRSQLAWVPRANEEWPELVGNTLKGLRATGSELKISYRLMQKIILR
jgi:hypothetical protein